jgi:hypothetical protein
MLNKLKRVVNGILIGMGAALILLKGAKELIILLGSSDEDKASSLAREVADLKELVKNMQDKPAAS